MAQDGTSFAYFRTVGACWLGLPGEAGTLKRSREDKVSIGFRENLCMSAGSGAIANDLTSLQLNVPSL